MPGPIRCVVDDRVATVTLDRPGALNAVDEGVLTGLRSTAVELAGDERVKAVLITGAGDSAFCVGLDIDLLGRAFADHAYFRSVLTRFRDMLVAVESIDVPVIAAVNGTTRAGGFELLLACDLAIAATEARIGDTHLAFGMMPGGGASVRAPRRLGWQVAADLLLTGRWIDGAEAVRLGLATRAVPRAELAGAASALASSFSARSRDALVATKRAMRAAEGAPAAAALDAEIEAFMAFLQTDRAAEGYRAFVEKRDPVWR